MSEPNTIKQVIVMRNDLNMRKGKMIAQGAHASLSFLTRRLENSDKIKLSKPEQEWLDSSFAKVCVRVDSEEQLMDIFQKAKDAMLEVHLITDSGKTEFHGEPTKTCLAIGPDYSSKIDQITGQLQLL
jgi:PTH2 family peptidyl-tRNA hydrolase